MKDLSIETTFAKELLDIIEYKMLRCAPNKREKVDVICTDLSKILDSIVEAENPGDFTQGLSPDHSRDLAYIRRDDSAPSLRAPSNISLFEEGHESSADDNDVMMGDESDPGLLMRTRSPRRKRGDNQYSDGHKDLSPNTGGQADSEIPEMSTIAATTRNVTGGHFSDAMLNPEHGEASREDATSFHVPGQSSPKTESNKTKKHRISQKSKKWFREHLVQLKRIWKG